MDSDLHHHYHQQPPQIMSSGLTRYRSAPSSYFSDLINSGIYGDDDGDTFFNTRISNDDIDQMLSRFTSSEATPAAAAADSASHQIMNQIGAYETQFADSVKQEEETIYSESQQQQPLIYQNQFQSQTDHNNRTLSTGRSTTDDSLRTMNPPTNLLRQSSSPAGFFAHLDIDNGWKTKRSR